MEPLSITECRTLMGQAQGDSLADAEIAQLRDMLYSLADVIVDAFVDLGNTDQSTFEPPGDAVDFFERSIAELIESLRHEDVQ